MLKLSKWSSLVKKERRNSQLHKTLKRNTSIVYGKKVSSSLPLVHAEMKQFPSRLNIQLHEAVLYWVKPMVGVAWYFLLWLSLAYSWSEGKSLLLDTCLLELCFGAKVLPEDQSRLSLIQKSLNKIMTLETTIQHPLTMRIWEKSPHSETDKSFFHFLCHAPDGRVILKYVSQTYLVRHDKISPGCNSIGTL